ncbi:MAG: VOC family protein, partial [Pseudomonadota bacterium]
TFNPGWNDDATAKSNFEDVRSLEARLEEAGVEILKRAEPGKGPAHFLIADPDGNQILIDQHETAPE